MSTNLSVSLAQYAVNGGLEGFGGMAQAQDVAELQKALTAGAITGRENEQQGATGGSVLKVESLENTLYNMTWKESDIVLWKKIPKIPATNTVVEYNLINSYGSVGSSFNRAGELPEEDDSAYARKSQHVKYMGTTRIVDHPMQLVNLISGAGTAVQSQVEAGTMKILRDVNEALVNADSSICPDEFDGIYKQHRIAHATLDSYYDSEIVIDCKGKALKDENVQAGSLAILQAYGYASLLMAPPGVLSSYVTRFHGQKLIAPNSPQVTAGIMGQKVDSIITQFGQVDLGYDLFMGNKGVKFLTSNPTSLKAPGAPIADGVAPVAVVTDAEAKATLFTGDHAYAVSAVNRYGESALTSLGTATVSAIEKAVNLKFTAGPSAVPATGFNIYRSLVNKATGTVAYYKIFSVSTTELAAGYSGGAAGLVRDRNYILPNTECAFLMDPTQEVFSFAQLCPLMKMDLAVTGPATRFMILLYGTPIVYAPKKIVKFVNIGTDLS